MPLNTVNNPPVVPGAQLPPGMFEGSTYFIVSGFLVSILIALFILWLIVKVWGSPIITAKAARSGKEAIIQHFENSKIGSLKLAKLGAGALRHKNADDGTLITTTKGINNLSGLPFANSWNLAGITVPTFLIGAITKLRHLGYKTRDDLEAASRKDEEFKDKNIIAEAYNFDDFHDLINKSEHPKKIPLEIEHVSDFIENVNQHYTESDITKEIASYLMGIPNNFIKTMLTTGITIFVVSLGMYFMLGAVK